MTGDDTAFRVYDVFRKLVAESGGDYSRSFATDRKVWMRAAAIVEEMELNPEKFVAAQFAAVKKSARRTLRPHRMLSNRRKCLENYSAAVVGDSGCTEVTPRQESAALAHLAAMEAQLVRLIHLTVPRRFESVDKLLMEASLPFCAWFRILSAPDVTDELKARYLDEARLQVMQDAPLKRILESEDVRRKYNTARISL